MKFTGAVLTSLLVTSVQRSSHGFIISSQSSNRAQPRGDTGIHAIDRGDGSTGGGGMLL